ncbi:4'-phosphopantetheinyl transferase [Kitasatospora sp. MAP12-15]|uniref:4'-phosphopantetheinyl transferase family protein n=1 Tax=unclassified Kitasatospora TaxID=2633591 RepID=UPI002474870C|nr:4'-phosphopantetheinyl transferase superfamily protein [Kitasatospora sp. MAP12-44]MDH6110624.1 4'-phosphopantetheinyl transferase [Kitasatospora sp. MAP12-44]
MTAYAGPGPGLLAGEPLRVYGPAGPWDAVREALAERGSAVLVSRLGDWLPADPDPVSDGSGAADAVEAADDCAVLGRDWARYQAMSHDQVRARFLASRLLLKHAAGEVLQARPETVDLAYKLGGRPYLRGCDQVDISLSHTEDLLVVGLTRRGWIGVDAELAARRLLGTGAEKQICTPHEISLLEAEPEHRRNPALVRLWTLKEAYSKAIGQGLRFRFTEFGFAPGAERVQVLRPDGSPGTGEEWSFGTWEIDRLYTVSVALFDAGFGDTADIAARTMLDDGLVDALIASGGREGAAEAQS